MCLNKTEFEKRQEEFDRKHRHMVFDYLSAINAAIKNDPSKLGWVGTHWIARFLHKDRRGDSMWLTVMFRNGMGQRDEGDLVEVLMPPDMNVRLYRLTTRGKRKLTTLRKEFG